MRREKREERREKREERREKRKERTGKEKREQEERRGKKRWEKREIICRSGKWEERRGERRGRTEKEGRRPCAEGTLAWSNQSGGSRIEDKTREDKSRKQQENRNIEARTKPEQRKNSRSMTKVGYCFPCFVFAFVRRWMEHIYRATGVAVASFMPSGFAVFQSMGVSFNNNSI
jgi:hypothetical protein